MSARIMSPVIGGVNDLRTPLINGQASSETEHARANSARARKALSAPLHKVHLADDESRAQRGLDKTRLSESPPAKTYRLSRSVKACQDDAFTLALWPKGQPGNVRWVPFRCNSWRCTARCDRRDPKASPEKRKACSCCCCKSAQSIFERMRASFARAPYDWSLALLTFDQKAFRQKYCRRLKVERAKYLERRRVEAPDGRVGEALVSKKMLARFEYDEDRCIQAAYKEIVRSFRSFAKWIRRNYGCENYVTVIERQQNGWPHLHVAIQSKKLHAVVTDRKSGVKVWIRHALRHAVACGFGRYGGFEPMRDAEAVAGYCVKASSAIAELAGGVVKDQLPHNAPARFRRVRASVGFLVPKVKSETLTGALVQEDVISILRAEQKRLSPPPPPTIEVADLLGVVSVPRPKFELPDDYGKEDSRESWAVRKSALKREIAMLRDDLRLVTP